MLSSVNGCIKFKMLIFLLCFIIICEALANIKEVAILRNKGVNY
jgi:hypothetical protein